MGRFKNGTPVTTNKTAKPNYDPNKDEDFDYEGDKGGKCPLHAHIRKVNPRGALGFIVSIFAREKTRRIARRGITYGERPDRSNGGGKGPPSNGVGLIFICYQNDISDQFEFIQKQWANDPSFPKIFTGSSGVDPVIGQDKGKEIDRDDPHWPTKWDASKNARKRVKFGEHVKLLGGEYFFAPSMEGLRVLGKATHH